jgi:AbrB family looped-hinge helix DNA binding protein
MSTITVSSKYQIVVPKNIREKIQLKSGQKMVVIVKGGIVHLVPERQAGSLKGFIKGLNTEGLREEEER